MIAEPLDLSLGPNAESIQDSFIRIWTFKATIRPFIFLALMRGYRDCKNHYATEEASFLWELSLTFYSGYSL